MGLCSGTLFALCSGIVAEQKRLHLRFQANTIRHRRVLSLFQLGKLILSAPDPPKLSQLELNTAARLIKAYEIIHQFVGVHECGTYFGTLYPVPLKGRPALYSGTLSRVPE